LVEVVLGVYTDWVNWFVIWMTCGINHWSHLLADEPNEWFHTCNLTFDPT
jgi:hypothetical protein